MTTKDFFEWATKMAKLCFKKGIKFEFRVDTTSFLNRFEILDGPFLVVYEDWKKKDFLKIEEYIKEYKA